MRRYADLERTPRPLRNEDYMGDVIVQKARQKRDFKFVFKRKIFLPSHNTPSEDNMFSRLVRPPGQCHAVIYCFSSTEVLSVLVLIPSNLYA